MDDEGEYKSAQAYQVIGCFIDDKFEASDAEWIRALDYFSDTKAYDDDFIPWPR